MMESVMIEESRSGLDIKSPRLVGQVYKWHDGMNPNVLREKEQEIEYHYQGLVSWDIKEFGDAVH